VIITSTPGVDFLEIFFSGKLNFTENYAEKWHQELNFLENDPRAFLELTYRKSSSLENTA
jgi:hypothetical protein